MVFNTSMTGYQEILTDPSYAGEIVTMTYPLIGNYGINPEDVESGRPHLSGFVVKEASEFPSNWRSKMSLDAYLKENGIVGIQGIDTRALVRHIRDKGAQTGIVSSIDLDPASLVEKARRAPSIVGRDLVREVTCKEAVPLERRALGSGQRLPAERPTRPNTRWSPTISASSATSCAIWSRSAAM